MITDRVGSKALELTCVWALVLAALASCTVGCVQGERASALATDPDAGVGAAVTEMPPKVETVTRAVKLDAPRCEDHDGDGFGLGDCRVDCDDNNSTITDGCVRCMHPATGCECAEGSAPSPCDVATDSSLPGPDGVCHLGARTCQHGQWSRCEAYRSPFQYVSPTVSCSNSCDPGCRHIVDCREAGDPAPTGPNLRLGTAPAAVFCPAGTGVGGTTTSCTTLGGGPYIRGTSSATWIDACAVPGHTIELVGSDDGTIEVSMPFTFAYFGVPFSVAGIGANGMLSFATPSTQWVNYPAPYAPIPNTIFAFWDDLYQRNGICVATVGVSPNRRFVTEWNDAGFYDAPSPSTHLTFEVILAESVHTIDVLYNQMEGPGDRPTGASATVGVQQGSGTSYDQVTYNTPGSINSGASVRWTPASGRTSCDPAVYTRIFTADCSDLETGIPVWGRFNYTSIVPPGTQIRLEARAADTVAGLGSATPVRLPNAPPGTPGTPTSLDLGQILFVSGIQNLVHRPVLQITAYLDPAPDMSAAPTLGSLEQQFSCTPNEISYSCQTGASCFSNPCRRGRINCSAFPAACIDDGAMPVGSSCGIGMVCDSTSACVPCNEGALCDAGSMCAIGRISCGTGVPVCNNVGALPSGSPCAVSPDTYTRGMAPPSWLEACGAPGSSTLLIGSNDGTTTATLPFAFRYYGRPFTSVGISANGLLGFTTASNQWVNSALPAAPLDSIYAFWDDLQMRDGVCTATFGVAPNRVFAVEWRNANFAGTPDTHAELTFEVLLEESTHTITTLYNTMRNDDDRASGASATIGIQRDGGSTYDQVAYNITGAVRGGSALRWTPSVTSACNSTGTCQVCSGTEVCDGADNDCDGLVDETIPTVTCGVGACFRSMPGCVRGEVPVCTPGTPVAETCNGIDDNCNGTVDEGCGGTLACPGDQTVAAGTGISLAAASSGMISGINWTIVSAPSGGLTSATWAPAPPTSATELFTPYIVGTYRLRVSGVDGSGVARMCEFNVNAIAQGLRVELTWDGPGDLDIHLHNNVTSQPWTTNEDCHYRNTTPAWGARLDVDNTTANGPENIRIDTPALLSNYTVAATNFARGAGRVATIKIYCNTSSTTPTAVFTSRPLAGNSSGLCTSNDFWRVATVRFTSGTACTVTPINTYTGSSNACSSF